MQRALLSRHRIEVPVMAFSAPPARVLRVAAQVYNSEEQVHALAAALRALLAETPHG
jgi:selenocysteine lyase/cysteine desulfurase